MATPGLITGSAGVATVETLEDVGEFNLGTYGVRFHATARPAFYVYAVHLRGDGVTRHDDDVTHEFGVLEHGEVLDVLFSFQVALPGDTFAQRVLHGLVYGIVDGHLALRTDLTTEEIEEWFAATARMIMKWLPETPPDDDLTLN